ncbi:SPOR domain-containing protein [Tardiphaga sp.]|uniref:SPOR domain-containing protein n=1 Tax=Tardiphaga sp. TaxID=1926292 RepID=UPI00260ADCA1|nr:SPOR domain-containing protein [Tardiphaga sp.]MDB5615989.1 Sporulation related protein [Tardiphaga sp.]
MADHRYQDRPSPAADDYSRAPDPSRARSEADPLAELARLIGQSDPFASSSQGGHGSQTRRAEPAAPDADEYTDVAPVGPPSWMKRVAAQETHQDTYQHETTDHQELDTVYPVKRYAPQPQPEAEYHPAPSFAPAAHADSYADHHAEPADPARYDDALYGQPDHGYEQPHDQNYQDDPYAYQDGYADEPAPKRRGGLMTVGVVLALAVIGTGAAYGYRTYIGSPRSGEPPVIKADAGPNKVVPPSSNDANAKLIQDRLGTAPEKVVSREEQPVNVQDATKAVGPRVVFPPLNQNANPPSTASVTPSAKPMVGNAPMPGDEPRKIRTLTVKGDSPDGTATPAARQAPARLTGAPPAAVPARPAATSVGGAPLSLSPQVAPAAAAPARVANNAPQQVAPAAASGGGYMVQIASQRSEAEASASFRALQGKYPSVLGSRSPQIKKADLGEKGTYYRAMVGPFGSQEEAAQMCGNLKTAGGQCVVQRN